MRHEGRVVIVTGALGGIGSALVERYLLEGARVGLIDLDEARGQAAAQAWRRQGHAVAFAAADVGRYAACAQAVDRIRAELGEVDTLVNNAGISPKHDGAPSAVQAMDPAEWDRVVGVNLSSAFYLTKLLAPGMIGRGFGRIVSMSSVAGKAAISRIVGVHYSATKAALIGFTRHVAEELGPHGITVNALAPGRISTPLLATVADDANQAVIRETALRRLGTPGEVADVCAFLTSHEAAFVTGQVVDVAGGWLMT
ncbi:SDR family oxidoreductase [Castellaniella defragrans]|jgi:3-oxoacyl-[acyl-carrier protein] reductase|uniref:3-oxoacyl-[acyl-carrier protein] reductase n=2 Tax=Castellaniella defragrans TaxID=75697 RepID=W8X8X2_CASD6|nr:SDR family NAD(P)-dependent oxidoreductase [Castellaniella defragrans]KAB0606238.1 SDR family oxidoreductase [Castellaniella defragrans]MBB6082912.1 3-oxoacyl-[acyl-carrier protein] reductase [Castellaniella defragrans]CDM23820.1 3-oxoacyl-[acyl-carrier protein] reductase [Castellaniella defragrans 65Phen]